MVISYYCNAKEVFLNMHSLQYNHTVGIHYTDFIMLYYNDIVEIIATTKSYLLIYYLD